MSCIGQQRTGSTHNGPDDSAAHQLTASIHLSNKIMLQPQYDYSDPLEIALFFSIAVVRTLILRLWRYRHLT